MKKKVFIGCLFCLLMAAVLLCAVSCGGEPQRKYKTTYGYFNTVTTVFDYTGGTEEEFEDNFDLVCETLTYYHKLFDIYNDAEGAVGLYEINREAGKSAVRVDGSVIDFLEYCKEIYELTEGEVNIAMGAVLRLWHECRTDASISTALARIPSRAELTEASLHCDINKIIINREESTVYLEDPMMSLDVGAIGKGYAVEMVAKRLVANGVEGYVLDVGGNLRMIGDRPSGKGYRTGIKDPSDPSGGYSMILTVSKTSTATSGGYERYFVVDDEIYHHIIDKDTLYPAEHMSSVTVITEDAGLADSLSTALFCMDIESGLALVESLDGVEAVWIKVDGTLIESAGIKDFEN